jgi:hypothetical protein
VIIAWVLTSGAAKYEIASSEGCVTSFQRTSHRERLFIRPGNSVAGAAVAVPNRGAALTLLRDLGSEPGGMAALRRVYAEAVSTTAICWQSDQLVLEELARRLVTGELRARSVAMPPIEVPVGALLPVSEPREPKKLAPEQPKWFEIELLDDGDPPAPMAGVKYKLELPDGTVIEGQLDDNGKARIAVADPSKCKVTFPEFDDNEWSLA